MEQEDREELIEEALARLDELCGLVEQLDLDESDRRRVMAELQGSEGGWLGEHLADVLRRHR